jgi:hypothetical protein
MAIADETVEEILASLSETPLAWLAAEGRAAVDALPERAPRTRGAEIETADEQLDVVERTLLEPLRRELAATARLAPLAKELGLSPNVELLLDDEQDQQRIVLNSRGRFEALGTFVGALDRAIGQARERVRTRRRTGQ